MTRGTTSEEINLSGESYQKIGESYSILGKYDEAIYSLTKAIELSSKNKEAYFERAVAYFETGNFDLSLSDFIQSGYSPKKESSPSKIPLEFSTGLIQGITLSATHSLEDFVPSMLCSLQGLSNGIWAFALDPKEVSINMINSCVEVVDFIRKNSAFDSLKAAIPELKVLTETWDEITEFKRGELVGNVIGKHGTDLFLLAGVGKGVKFFGELRKANSILTLNTMKSLEKRAVLEEISRQWKTKTAKELEALKSGKLKKDKELYKKYRESNLSEQQIRKILHEAGYETFPKPKGIPETWKVKFSKSQGGMRYFDPSNPNHEIRVMQGNPNSPNPAQRNPYVVHKTPKGRLTKEGTLVTPKDPLAHIPLSEYKYSRLSKEIK